MRLSSVLAALLLGSVTGCGGAPAAIDAAGDPDSGAACACGDDLYCNGAETCGADGACIDGSPPCTAMQTCDETADRCESSAGCDVDGDGHDSIVCGGVDCDDDDADRYPGHTEICDGANVDEDCDPATVGSTDSDGDGYVSAICCNGDACGDDCDDADATVHPTANDFCNGVDEDCDTGIDEAGFVAQWVDADADGYGDSTMPMSACPETSGLTDNDDDCDDGEAIANPSTPEVCDSIDNDCDGTADDGATEVSWYVDSDGDGFGSATAEPVRSCAPVSGHVPRAGDCDDTVRAVNPAAAERCNGRDDDCNGAADFRISTDNLEDDDGDGAPDAMCPGGAGTDCDDTNAEIGPTVPDFCGDAVDNNCNGTVDEATGMSTWYLDADGDGWGDSSSTPITSCMPQAGRSFRMGDCDDADENIHVGLIDGCDGLDVDCDGEADEDGIRYAYFADTDGDGYGAGAAIFSCVAPTGTSTMSGDCAPTDATRYPSRAEDCNVVDDDCDGTVDEGAALMTFYEDADRDGHGRAGGMTRMACVAPLGFAASTNDCDDGSPVRYPGATELCNGQDDDCDAVADDPPDADVGCGLPNATATCNSGFCEVSACAANFGNCDGTDANGCELDLRTSEADCGACGSACPIGNMCSAGACDGSAWAQVVAFGNVTCARRTNGAVVCWGSNQLGLIDPDNSALTSNPQVVAGVSSSVDVATNGIVACSIDAAGTVTCWGLNADGALGGTPGPAGSISSFMRGDIRRPAPIVGVADVIDVEAAVVNGAHTVCAVRRTGRVVCWGSAGLLGDGSAAARPTPGPVTGIADAVDLAHSASGFCARRMSGAVACWAPIGDSRGCGTGGECATPVTPVGLSSVTSIFSGGGMCATRSSGPPLCWGAHTLISPDLTLQGESLRVPTDIGLSGLVAMGSNNSGSFCAARPTAECWMTEQGYGTLGRGSSTPPTGYYPTAPVAGPLSATQLTSSGSYHICALDDAARIWCWGRNDSRQLGDGTTSSRNAPTLIREL